MEIYVTWERYIRFEMESRTRSEEFFDEKKRPVSGTLVNLCPKTFPTRRKSGKKKRRKQGEREKDLVGDQSLEGFGKELNASRMYSPGESSLTHTYHCSLYVRKYKSPVGTVDKSDKLERCSVCCCVVSKEYRNSRELKRKKDTRENNEEEFRRLQPQLFLSASRAACCQSFVPLELLL